MEEGLLGTLLPGPVDPLETMPLHESGRTDTLLPMDRRSLVSQATTCHVENIRDQMALVNQKDYKSNHAHHGLDLTSYIQEGTPGEFHYPSVGIAVIITD